MNDTFLGIVGIIAVIVPAVLMILQWIGVRNYNKKLANTVRVGTVCAGSEHPNTPKEMGVADLKCIKFKDDEGNAINLDEYECKIACGWSMLLDGIDDEDLLLFKPVELEKINNLRFPSILIIERDEFSKENAKRFNDFAEMKVRKSWSLCDMSKQNPVEVMKQCMKNEEYVDVSKQYEDMFPSDEKLISDFEDRVERYMNKYPSCKTAGDNNQLAVISTTFDPQKQRVHFSIHPVKDIKGEVYYSFHIRSKKAA